MAVFFEGGNEITVYGYMVCFWGYYALFMGLPWNAEVKNNCLQCMMRWDGPSSKCDTVCQHEWKHVVVYLPKRQHR